MCDANKPWLNDPRKTEIEKQMDAGTYVPFPESEMVTQAEREMMERDSSFSSERPSAHTPDGDRASQPSTDRISMIVRSLPSQEGLNRPKTI